MAFYFALFNVSNANHEARDKTQQQHVITSYAQSVECGAPAQHASRLDTSATRVMRKISQRRHSVANDSRLASRSAKIQSSSTPRRCSSPISQAKPSPTTSILSHHNAERDLTRRWTRVEERRRNNNNGNSKNNSSKNNSNNTLSTASTLSSHSSLASCTLRSSSSSGANVGAGDATQTSLSISTEGTPTAIAETVSVASALPVTATYWQAKRESLKRILRRNSAAASFARRKQRIDQENALTEKTVLKGALIKSPAIASSALPKRVKFMAGSLSSSVISSPMASLCFLSHNDSDKLLPSLPFSSSQLSSSALKKYRVRTAFPPPRKSLKPQNHTRKLSADDISFFSIILSILTFLKFCVVLKNCVKIFHKIEFLQLKYIHLKTDLRLMIFVEHTDLKEWNVRAVILPSRNRKTNNNNGELIEIVSGRHQRQQPSILEPNNNNVNNKALKTRESSDTNTVLSICDGNYCMPMQLDNGKRCANKITVRRTRSSRTAVEPIQNLGEKPRNDKHRRLHRCHSEKDQTESPAITLTTGSSVQERILLHRRRKCLAEWSSSANQREKQTCKTSLIRRRSTSDRRRQSSNTHAGYRRVDDKENLLAKISENNRLFSRFKNLFVDDGTANFGINDGLKHEEGDVPRRMSIRRHFSAITRSAISTPTTVKRNIVGTLAR